MISATPSRIATLRIEPEYDRLLRAHELLTVAELFDDKRVAALGAERLDKPGLEPWRSRLRLTLTDAAGHATTLYVKRYENPPATARRQVAKSGNGAKTLAGVEWGWMQRLARDGIPCVEPVALGEDVDGAREVRSVLVTREVPGMSLERWLHNSSPERSATVRSEGIPPQSHLGKGGGCAAQNAHLISARENADWIRSLLNPLADFVARFHSCGYVHRDLYLSHIFCDAPCGTSPAGVYAALRLIDLQRLSKPTGYAQRLIIKDLAALNYSSAKAPISNRDRVRWFKRYLGVGRLDAGARRMVYWIVGKTQQIARHDARRNARLSQRGLDS